MKSKFFNLITVTLFTLLCSVNALAISDGAVEISGEQKQWHKVTLTCGGPSTGEANATNPFLNYRLQVKFTQGSLSYSVPGYFAADGNAGETGATSGNVWKCHFNAPTTGVWNYSISFRSGANASIGGDNAGTALAPLDGKTGAITISASDKTGRDMRAKGRLEYVGAHQLKFKGSGEYFMKAGPDSPENLLAYYDFDNTGTNTSLMKTWAPHVSDWKTGDPSWKSGKGKGLIGPLN